MAAVATRPHPVARYQARRGARDALARAAAYGLTGWSVHLGVTAAFLIWKIKACTDL